MFLRVGVGVGWGVYGFWPAPLPLLFNFQPLKELLVNGSQVVLLYFTIFCKLPKRHFPFVNGFRAVLLYSTISENRPKGIPPFVNGGSVDVGSRTGVLCVLGSFIVSFLLIISAI